VSTDVDSTVLHLSPLTGPRYKKLTLSAHSSYNSNYFFAMYIEITGLKFEKTVKKN
jgi:hypothetical protein